MQDKRMKKSKAASSKIKWNFLIPIIFISLFSVFIFTRQESIPFPAELTGLWETDDPRYSDRFFEIVFQRSFGNNGIDTADFFHILFF